MADRADLSKDLGFIPGLTFGSDPETPDPSQTRLTNPLGALLLNRLIQQYGGGAGDFGFGGLAKQGTATLNQSLAGRGINPSRGGVGDALRAKMLGSAMAADEQNRREFLARLGSTGPALASGQRFTGPGWINTDFSNIGKMEQQAGAGYGASGDVPMFSNAAANRFWERR